MRVAVVQMNSGTDREANVQKACGYINRAVSEHGADLVILPEFFNTIFFAQYRDSRYFDWAERDDGPTITAVRACADRNSVNVIATIYEEVDAGLYFDTAVVIGRDGSLGFKYRKVHPAAVHSLEKIYFRYGTRFDTTTIDGWRVGVGICYDMSFPETGRCLAVNGAELLVAPYATTRANMFQEVLRTRAFENGCFLAAANKVGREGEWTFSGGSVVVDPAGKVLAAGDVESESLLVAEISKHAVKHARIAFPNRRDRRPDLYARVTAEVDPTL